MTEPRIELQTLKQICPTDAVFHYLKSLIDEEMENPQSERQDYVATIKKVKARYLSGDISLPKAIRPNGQLQT